MENQGFPTICIEKIGIKFLKKNLEGTVINIGESFSSDDFLDQAEREKKELEESYQESLRQTKERKEKDGS